MFNFFIYNFSTEIDEIELDTFKEQKSLSNAFILKTCQRTLILSDLDLRQHEVTKKALVLNSTKAYQYVLEMLCGLKSRLIAENEITAQFKAQLAFYLKKENRSKTLTITLQKLLQDCKKIRAKHLTGISQKTYAAIVRKILSSNKNRVLLILGSGQLAEDLINQFKKNYTVFISARNTKKVEQLQKKHNIKVLEWKSFKDYQKIDIHINTIGTDDNLFEYSFLNSWHQNSNARLVDLSNPTPYKKLDLQKIGIQTTFLNDIWDLGATEVDKKNEKINLAQEDIIITSMARKEWINNSFSKVAY